MMACVPALALECPAERAEYRLIPQPEITAGFIPAKHNAGVVSDLYVRLTTTQRSYWFEVDVSNGYGGQYLFAVGDPYVAEGGDPDNGPVRIGIAEDDPSANGFYAMDKELNFVGMPQKGEPAPAYLLMIDLGRVLWYAPSAISTDKKAERDSMDRGVFKLVRCLQKAPAEAYP